MNGSEREPPNGSERERERGPRARARARGGSGPERGANWTTEAYPRSLRARARARPAHATRSRPALALYSVTTYRVPMPSVKWKEMWQWKSQVPTLSGVMSAMTISIGFKAATSDRM